MASVLPKAVHAASVVLPKELTPDWMMMLETEYMQDCMPAGMPICSTLISRCLWMRTSFQTRRLLSGWRISASTTSAALIACASTVAMATPATPIGITTTSSRSSATLAKQHTIR